LDTHSQRKQLLPAKHNPKQDRPRFLQPGQPVEGSNPANLQELGIHSRSRAKDVMITHRTVWEAIQHEQRNVLLQNVFQQVCQFATSNQ
jgi:hypothetical protein